MALRHEIEKYLRARILDRRLAVDFDWCRRPDPRYGHSVRSDVARNARKIAALAEDLERAGRSAAEILQYLATNDVDDALDRLRDLGRRSGVEDAGFLRMMKDVWAGLPDHPTST